MIGVAMYITIKSLWERHKNKSMIARLTGHDWKTVAKRIKEIEEGKEYPKKKPHPRILDSYRKQIMKKLWGSDLEILLFIFPHNFFYGLASLSTRSSFGTSIYSNT